MNSLPIGLNALAAGKSIGAQDAAEAPPTDDFAKMLAPREQSMSSPRPRPANDRPAHAEQAAPRERPQPHDEPTRARHTRRDDDASHTDEHRSRSRASADTKPEPHAQTQAQEASASASSDDSPTETTESVDVGEQLWPPTGLAGLGLMLPPGQAETSVLGQVQGSPAGSTSVATSAATADAILPTANTAQATLASQNLIAADQSLPISADILLGDQQNGALQLDSGLTADSQAKALDFAQLVSPDLGLVPAQDATLATLGITADDLLQAQASADTGVADLGTTAVPQLAASNTRGVDTAIFDGDPTPIPQLHGEDFDDAISTRLNWLAQQKIGHAHIKLNPDDLGPVEVHLRLDGDKIDASFTSAHAEVRQALEQSLPRLRDMLGQHGFQLGNTDVGQQQHGDGNGHSSALAGNGVELAAGDELDSVGISPLTLRQRGLLDAYA